MRSDKGPWTDADILKVGPQLFSFTSIFFSFFLFISIQFQLVTLSRMNGIADGSEWCSQMFKKI